MSSCTLAVRTDLIPHRKVNREWLQPVTSKNTTHALALVAVDLAAFALVLVAFVLLPHPSLQLLAGALAGLVIGRLVSTPSLTPYSLWDVGHNVVHHGYTNLKDFDFVWQPLSLDGYQRLPAWR